MEAPIFEIAQDEEVFITLEELEYATGMKEPPKVEILEIPEMNHAPVKPPTYADDQYELLKNIVTDYDDKTFSRPFLEKGHVPDRHATAERLPAILPNPPPA